MDVPVPHILQQKERGGDKVRDKERKKTKDVEASIANRHNTET